MSAVTIVFYRDRKRLADLLARVGSEHEGERSADCLDGGLPPSAAPALDVGAAH